MLIGDVYRKGLQEITAIAMEQASESLARLLEIFVTLSEPHIEIMEPSDIEMALNAVDSNSNSYAVCQAFIGGGMAGEAMLLYNNPCFKELAAIMRYEDEMDEKAQRELLMDTTNLLFGACIKGIAEQIDMTFSFSPPMLLNQYQENSEFLEIQNHSKRAGHSKSESLVVEISYQFENKDIRCDLLIVFTKDSVQTLMHKMNYLNDE